MKASHDKCILDDRPTLKKQDDNSTERDMLHACFPTNQSARAKVPLQNATTKGPQIKVGAPKGQSLLWTRHKCMPSKFVPCGNKGVDFWHATTGVTRISTIVTIGLEECTSSIGRKIHASPIDGSQL